MDCKNHLGVSALDRCTACAEPFCSNCLVEIHGQRYCGSCKVVAVKRKTAPLDDVPGKMCSESKESLGFAIAGLFICAIIFGIVALSKAGTAKSRINADPSLDGRGVATAAQVIAVGGLLFWVLGMVTRALMN